MSEPPKDSHEASQLEFNRLRERLCGPIERATRYGQAMARVESLRLELQDALDELKRLMDGRE